MAKVASVSSHSPPAPIPALVDFVIHHAQIRTNICTRQVWETGYKLDPRTVPDYNFIFVTRGQVVWDIEGQGHELGPGWLALVPPGVQHRGYSRTAQVTFVSVHVEVALPGGQDVFELLIPPRVQQVAAGSRLDGYLRGALGEFDRPQESQALLMLPGWSRLIVLELLRDNAERGLLRHRAIDPLVAEMLEELNRRIERPTTLADLARRAGFSPQHLNRTFQRELGVTPLKYLMRMRLEHAAELLRENKLTIRAIAGRLGFGDVCYFTRLFSQRFGQSPARYRESSGSKSPS